MELRRFISQTILDIVGAVKDAQNETFEGCVVPSIAQTFTAVQHGVSEIQAIEFEVTIRADERAGSEAKLNVVAAFVGGGVKGESGKSGGHAATLKFRVPVRLPCSGPKKVK